MKIAAHFKLSSGKSLVLILGLIAGSMAIAGCTDPQNNVVNDTSTSKNKRVSRIDKAKGTPPGAGVQKDAP